MLPDGEDEALMRAVDAEDVAGSHDAVMPLRQPQVRRRNARQHRKRLQGRQCLPQNLFIIFGKIYLNLKY